MARKQPNNTDSSSRNSATPQQQNEDDDSLLSSCEQGGAASEDTASLSITQDGSFLSSFSQDTQEDAVMDMLHWNKTNSTSNNSNSNNNNLNAIDNHNHHHPLRHRRTLHHHDDLHLLEEEEGELASYNREHENDHDNDEAYEYHDPYESENSKNHHHSLRRTSKLQFRRQKLKLLGAALLSFSVFICILGLFPMAQQLLQGRRRWKLPSQQRRRQVLQQLQEQPVPNRGLTLRVSGKHVDLLHRAVEQYARCPVVTHIQIDWTCPEERDMPKSLLALQHNKGKLLLQQQQRPGDDDSSNNNIPTTAILLLDEHVVLHCQDIVNAFAEWKQDPSRLVGLVPSHKHASYSLLSDAAAIVHRFYWRSSQKAAATSVLPGHCHHVALSAWVTALSHQSPIAMVSNVMLLPDFDESNDNPENRLSSPVNVPDDCYRKAARAAGLSVLPETSGTILGGVTYF